MLLIMLLPETEPEMAARDQSKLSASGLTNTPKVYWKLAAENTVAAPAMAITQP
jgi:hypothetical protein